MDGLKGRLGKCRLTENSDLANSSGVSISELLNWEIELYTVVLELVSDSMLDEVL